MTEPIAGCKHNEGHPELIGAGVVIEAGQAVFAAGSARLEVDH